LRKLKTPSKKEFLKISEGHLMFLVQYNPPPTTNIEPRLTCIKPKDVISIRNACFWSQDAQFTLSFLYTLRYYSPQQCIQSSPTCWISSVLCLTIHVPLLLLELKYVGTVPLPFFAFRRPYDALPQLVT
jgi:hypothetical protein